MEHKEYLRWSMATYRGNVSKFECNQKSLQRHSICVVQRCSHNRRKFRSQTSDNMDRWKAEMGRVREEKRREEERRSQKRKSQKKEDPGARKGRKVAKHCVFPMICGSGGSKSMRRFVRFHLEMCFAPQRRALFRHLSFQKWSEQEALCTFSLGNVLRATTACTFSTSQLQKVLRTCSVF